MTPVRLREPQPFDEAGAPCIGADGEPPRARIKPKQTSPASAGREDTDEDRALREAEDAVIRAMLLDIPHHSPQASHKKSTGLGFVLVRYPCPPAKVEPGVEWA
eukprot:CAMPEP_0181216924 /NCGR_PEP_ID=MMETSP1096-20121128/26859_1 /TAXON_ID=156174 ORGANISM="Chrysochromulina ericina, Strain CCMP281" /NCGR_SAMPLE_ID=MMETSP1096 /ASSEMBLY_ACC=CAM_ASM_000453 /LENGTH=103 /DNA_ID=CAMNT_0023308985 /DNA_START=524 /DNA_END=836 /DNA_ORIENTATION=+